jgi:hypothetical protein
MLKRSSSYFKGVNFMKRSFCFVALLLLTLVSIVAIYGCGSTTTAASTTTGTVNAAQSSTAQSGVLMASGAASIGVAANALGSTAGSGGSISVSAIRSSSVRAMTGNPPPGLFTQDMTTGTASVDGYFTPLATPLFSGKLTPYIRFINRGGEVIKGPFFSGKQIANLAPCSVEAVFAGGPGQPPVGIATGMQNFMTNQNYNSIKYMADYLAWAYIYPTMETAVRSHFSLPSNVHLTSPQAVTTDKILAMDNKMVYSGVITGEIVVTVSCEADGRAKVGTWTGTGTLETPVGKTDITTGITFTTLGNPPTLVTVVATNETAPQYTTIVYVTSPQTGVGTGEIWDYSVTPAVQIGTLTTSSTGGTITVGVTTETFTF